MGKKKQKGLIVKVLVSSIDEGVKISELVEVNSYPINIVIEDESIAKDLADNYKVIVVVLSEMEGEVGFKIDDKTAKLMGIDTYPNLATFKNYLQKTIGGK